jgi:ribose-phosphate pyrophosphokinase
MRGEEIAYVTEDGEVPTFVNVERYPDGSPMVKHWPDWTPTRILLRPQDSAGFLAGIFWIDSLKQRGANPELVIPCLFGQRQDRVNPEGDTLFTAKSVGKLINSLDLPKVIVLDPHSDVSHAVIDRCLVVNVDDIWEHHFGEDPHFYSAVVAADAGGVKRAARIAKLLKLPLKVADKKRDVSNGKITGFKIEDCSDLFVTHEEREGIDQPHVLVVDDLCDGGGTFIGLEEVLDRVNLTADLFVTHGLFTKGTLELTNRYRKVICTDSVAARRPDVEVLYTANHLLTHGEL